MRLRVDDWVEVRDKEEILSTLDPSGRLDGLPFMPSMFKYCGQRFRVFKSAHKTCDTVSGRYVGRRVADAVHLNLRCDGHAYGGCQAGCLIFWKTAWLKPVDGPAAVQSLSRGSPPRHKLTLKLPRCEEADVVQATMRCSTQGTTIYSCQATELLKFTTPLRWWDARQYVESCRSGNSTLLEISRGLFFLCYSHATLAASDRWGGLARWLYNKVQALRGGMPFPCLKGKIPIGQAAPRSDLNLQPGDLVRVKSYEDILATLNTDMSNRGLKVDAEILPFCGKTFRVETCIKRFVDERTGELKQMKTPAVALAGVYCKGLYSGQRMFCPRAIHLWCREVWLERVPSPCPQAAPGDRKNAGGPNAAELAGPVRGTAHF